MLELYSQMIQIREFEREAIELRKDESDPGGDPYL